MSRMRLRTPCSRMRSSVAVTSSSSFFFSSFFGLSSASARGAMAQAPRVAAPARKRRRSVRSMVDLRNCSSRYAAIRGPDRSLDIDGEKHVERINADRLANADRKDVPPGFHIGGEFQLDGERLRLARHRLHGPGLIEH